MYMGVAPYRATPIYDKYLNLVEPLKGGLLANRLKQQNTSNDHTGC